MSGRAPRSRRLSPRLARSGLWRLWELGLGDRARGVSRHVYLSVVTSRQAGAAARAARALRRPRMCTRSRSRTWGALCCDLCAYVAARQHAVRLYGFVTCTDYATQRDARNSRVGTRENALHRVTPEKAESMNHRLTADALWALKRSRRELSGRGCLLPAAWCDLNHAVSDCQFAAPRLLPSNKRGEEGRAPLGLGRV